MAKIISTPNCGNSPKMEFLKEFNIAFANGDLKFLKEKVTEEIEWILVGEKNIRGKESFIAELEKLSSGKTEELKIEQLLSHGKEGAANGIMKKQNGKTYAFSNFYKFSNAKGEKLKSITSYTIEIK